MKNNIRPNTRTDEAQPARVFIHTQPKTLAGTCQVLSAAEPGRASGPTGPTSGKGLIAKALP